MIRMQCPARCLLAQLEGGRDETGGGLPAQSHREAITQTECSYVPCQRPAQFHAATVPLSSDSRPHASRSQKAQTVSLASCQHHLSKADLYQWCCIDLSNAPRLSGVQLLTIVGNFSCV